MKKLIFTILSLTAIQQMYGFEFNNEFNFIGGYRHDDVHFDTSIHFDDAALPEHFVIKNLNIWEVGVTARYKIPTWDYCECESFLNNFYLDGFVKWGWGGNGNKFELTDYDSPPTELVNITKGKLKNAQTFDYQIALGYLYDWECWGLGLLGGYAYNYEHIKTKNGKTAELPTLDVFVNDPFFDGDKYEQIWQGPYLGVDFLYHLCNWNLDLGYEHHFAHYHAKNTINPAFLTDGFSDVRKTHSAHGDVIFLNGEYLFCNGWHIGLGVKYQYWTAKDGEFHPTLITFESLGLPAGTVGKATGNWTSYNAHLNVGYEF